MANLLPAKESSALALERRHRLLASVLVLVAGLCVSGTVLLIPAGAVLFLSKESAERRLETTRKLVELERTATAGDLIADTKEKMEIAGRIEMLIAPHELIERVVGFVPSGIALDQLAFSREGMDMMLEISGGAMSRSALLAFSDALKGSGLFTDVVIPIEALAQNTDLRFRLTLSLTDDALIRL